MNVRPPLLRSFPLIYSLLKTSAAVLQYYRNGGILNKLLVIYLYIKSRSVNPVLSSDAEEYVMILCILKCEVLLFEFRFELLTVPSTNLMITRATISNQNLLQRKA